MYRRTGFHVLALCFLLATTISQLGCEPENGVFSEANAPVNAPNQNNATPNWGSSNSGRLVSTPSNSFQRSPLLDQVPARSPQTILIASFNIQTFGVKKVGNPKVLERLARIISLFDVVAIQEIRAVDQTVVPQLLNRVNSEGGRFDYIIGPHLGRSNSKEQYAYVYDTNKLISSPQHSYTVEDSADLLHREPLVARFVTRVPQNFVPFSFSLMNIHTDPDEVKQELPVMHTVLKGVREYEWATAHEDDVILMGDLNAGPSQFGPLAQIPGIYWTIQNQPTNTRRKEIYDNMIFDRQLTTEFTGRAGVLDLQDFFRISESEALELSDHCPVWAEFSIVEQSTGGNYSVARDANGLPLR